MFYGTLRLRILRVTYNRGSTYAVGERERIVPLFGKNRCVFSIGLVSPQHLLLFSGLNL